MRAPRLSILAAAVIGGLSAVANASERSPLPAAREVPEQVRSLVQRFVDQVDALPGYQVVMTKQQRIGGTLSPAETLLLKQTRSPDCRYMKWIAEPNQGREVILCSDRYEGKIKVHEGGLLGIATLSLDPDGSLARQGNLRPIRQAGVYNMAAMLKADIQRRAASGTIDAPIPPIATSTAKPRCVCTAMASAVKSRTHRIRSVPPSCASTRRWRCRPKCVSGTRMAS